MCDLWVSTVILTLGLLIVYFQPERYKVIEVNKLVVGILSARENFMQRQSLRQSWLQNNKNNSSWMYKFIIGDKACNIPTQIRVSPYTCDRLKFAHLSDNWNFDLFYNMEGSQHQPIQATIVHNITIQIHHPVIIRQLGISSLLKLTKVPITVTLFDEFRQEIVTKATFTDIDGGILRSRYRYQTVQSVFLPEGFHGSIKTFVPNLTSFSLTHDSSYSLFEKSGVITVISIDAYDYPRFSTTNQSIFLPSMHYTIMEQNRYDEKLKQQQSKYIDNKVLDEGVLKIQQEIVEYEDIVLIDMIDVYRNLPEKLVKFHEWVDTNIETEFVMKTDDDCYVDIETIMSELDRYKGVQKLWWGNFRHDWVVERFGKWAELNYRAETYPAFACGSGNVVSSDISTWIAQNSKYLHKYQGEDISMSIWMSAIGPNYTVDNRWQCEKVCVNGSLVIPELSIEEVVKFSENKHTCSNPCFCDD